MSVKRIRNHGTWVWQARVAYKRLRRAAFRSRKDEAREAEADPLRALKMEHGQAEQAAASPATLRQLLARYADDMRARGKAEESVDRVDYTRRNIEAVTLELLDLPVSRIGDTEIFAFRNARARAGVVIYDLVDDIKMPRRIPAKQSTINRDLRTLRTALKRARPELSLPGRSVLPRGQDARPLAAAGGGAAHPRGHAVAVPRDRQARRSDAYADDRDPDAAAEEVHLEQGVILLPRAKAGARPVILSEPHGKIVQAQIETHSGSHLVFPGPAGRPYSREQIGKVFWRHARGVGLRDFHFRDLRHHGATMALNKGFTAPIVMALGGWKTERMMRRYAAVTDATLRAAAEAVSGSEVATSTAMALR
jgi:hypothetical protein